MKAGSEVRYPSVRPRFLVTAGNTREQIDHVRDWGNRFTGNTGLSIARALRDVGDVELLTSNTEHLELIRREGQPALTCCGFRSHAELRDLLEGKFAPGAARPDGVFMTAAISDYRPERTYEVVRRERLPDGTEAWLVRDAQAGKVKSSYERIAVLGQRTEKLVDLFRGAWGYEGLLVKFKLEVGLTSDRLLEIGRPSRVASGADVLVANTLDMVPGGETSGEGGGFGPGAYVLRELSTEWVPRDRLAARLAELAGTWWARGQALRVEAGSFVCG